MNCLNYQSSHNKSILESNGKIGHYKMKFQFERENINNREKYDEELQTLKQVMSI